MKNKYLFMLIVACIANCSSITAQIQTGVFRTPAGNTDYHVFSINNPSWAAAYILQSATDGPILRLSSGTPDATKNVKFSFENNGSLGIGTTNITEKMVLYDASTVPVLTQYSNFPVYGSNRGFVVGINSDRSGMVWNREGLPISFGTSNVERMRINSSGTIDMFSAIYMHGSIQSASGAYKIDTTGIFSAKAYRTLPNNTNPQMFSINNPSYAAAYINQEATTDGPILRLSSGTPDATKNVKFSFENNGNLGLGTLNIAEKLVLYGAGTVPVLTQYLNFPISGSNRGFVVGINSDRTGMVWNREGLPISFGTSNVERMRITSSGTIDLYSTIQSASGAYKIDTTGIFSAKAYRTLPNNTNPQMFSINNPSYAAAYINQVATDGPILRLSSGTPDATKNVKFSFENNGSLGIGTTNITEKMVLYDAGGAIPVLTQYSNFPVYGSNRGFVVGINSDRSGMVWNREALPISFGTSNKERMRINSSGTIEMFGTIYMHSSIQSASGDYKIDTTGIFSAKAYRTLPNNTTSHTFSANNTTYAAAYINQEATTGAILRLSGGTTDVTKNVKFSFENSGNFGLGTINTTEKITMYNAGATPVLTQYVNNTVTGGSTRGFVLGITENGTGTVWHREALPVTFGTSNIERMRINANGNIGIGTVSPDYKLDVVGVIRAHSVQISTAKTADFVFDDDYRLRPLPEVERYITANKHLPEVAPAAEMKEKGVDVADMQIKLLQKIEELTLYVIQQQKEIEELKGMLNEKK